MLLLGMNSINITERHLLIHVYFFSVAEKWANLDVYPQMYTERMCGGWRGALAEDLS